MRQINRNSTPKVTEGKVQKKKTRNGRRTITTRPHLPW